MDWPDVKAWRKETRETLLRARVTVPGPVRQAWTDAIDRQIRAFLASHKPHAIGFYFPFRGEFDARRIVADWIASGASGALPEVVDKKGPLKFWRWTPDAETEPGVYQIPVPKSRILVEPDLLLVPLVGFDAQGFRLGYGGGYYDRTLAAMAKTPFTLGIGFELSRIETLHPQPHDIPMNAIVTETGLVQYGR
jgi:5-formyltetrahydrofolate cyclo-ligase